MFAHILGEFTITDPPMRTKEDLRHEAFSGYTETKRQDSDPFLKISHQDVAQSKTTDELEIGSFPDDPSKNTEHFAPGQLPLLSTLIFDEAITDQNVEELKKILDEQPLILETLIFKTHTGSLNLIVDILRNDRLSLHLSRLEIEDHATLDTDLSIDLRLMFGNKQQARFPILKHLTLSGENIQNCLMQLQDEISFPSLESVTFISAQGEKIDKPDIAFALRQSLAFGFYRKVLSSAWEAEFSKLLASLKGNHSPYALKDRILSNCAAVINRTLNFYLGTPSSLLFSLNEHIRLRGEIDVFYSMWEMHIISQEHKNVFSINVPGDKKDFQHQLIDASFSHLFKFLSEAPCSDFPFKRLRAISWINDATTCADVLNSLTSFVRARPLEELSELKLENVHPIPEFLDACAYINQPLIGRLLSISIKNSDIDNQLIEKFGYVWTKTFEDQKHVPIQYIDFSENIFDRSSFLKFLSILPPLRKLRVLKAGPFKVKEDNALETVADLTPAVPREVGLAFTASHSRFPELNELTAHNLFSNMKTEASHVFLNYTVLPSIETVNVCENIDPKMHDIIIRSLKDHSLFSEISRQILHTQEAVTSYFLFPS